MVIERTELLPVLVGLLVVEGDDGLVLAKDPRGRRVGPLPYLLVELGPGALEQAPVRRISDEDVMKAMHRLIAPVGARRLDELLAPQPLEQEVDRLGRVSQVPQRPQAELGAHHRGELEQRPLVHRQPLDAHGEQRLDRRGHLHRVSVDGQLPGVAAPLDHVVVHQHAHELPHEQRVAVGGGRQPGNQLRRQMISAEEAGREQLGGRRVKTVERDDIRHPPPDLGQRRSDVAQLRAGQANEQDRHLSDPLGEVLQEVEQQRLRPLDVVDDHHHGAVSREGLDQTAEGPERLLGRAGGRRPDDAHQPVDHAIALAHPGGDQLAQARSRLPGFEAIPQRSGDAGQLDGGGEGGVARSVTAEVERRDGVAERRDQLARQAGLADPRRTEHGHEPGRRRRDRVVEGGPKATDLGLAPDERR